MLQASAATKLASQMTIAAWPLQMAVGLFASYTIVHRQAAALLCAAAILCCSVLPCCRAAALLHSVVVPSCGTA